MKKRLPAILIILTMMLNIIPVVSATESTNNSKQLMVRANQLVLAESPNTTVRLVGVNLPGAEWTGTPAVERLTRNAVEAITNWDSNCLRVSVNEKGWFGNYDYVSDGGVKYRNYIDSVIDIASQYGVYVILDFHRYESFNSENHLNFWRDAAVRYANNPTVLYGILNEPHSTSWEVWRNGNGADITGHQQVVEMIRDLGAKNVIVAGGLSWAYNLSGLANGYALVDQGSNDNDLNAGYGIMYDSHIYPWKGLPSSWNNSVGRIRKMFPVLIGEVGWDPATNQSVGGKVYQEGSEYYHDKWCPAFFDWADDAETYGSQAHYTAYSFHPISAPKMLGDRDNFKDDANYSYPPTEYWGVYVKNHLASVADKHYGTLNLPVSISVSGAKTSYVKGYPLDLSKGEVIATYSDGSTESIELSRADVKVTGFDSSAVTPSQTITVSFQEQQTSYDIEVVPFTVMGPDTPPEQDISNKYLSIDFEDAEYHVNSDSTIDYSIIDTTNKATGNKISINTYLNSASNYYRIKTDSTQYIATSRKHNSAFDFRPEAAVYESGKLVYADFRVKRVDYQSDDPVSIYFTDSNDNRIFGINYASGKIPTLIASQTYGTDTNDPSATDVNYSLDGNWHCIRAIINFETATFELYQGSSFDNLTNFVNNVDYFSFISASAADLGRITNYGIGNRKGALGFDDISIYTVNPSEEAVRPRAKDLVIDGDLCEGEMLSGYYSVVNADDSLTQLYWDVSDSSDFSDYTTVAENTNEYTLQSSDVGKYIRFRVVPANADGLGNEVSVVSTGVIKASIVGIEVVSPKTDYYVKDTFDYTAGYIKVNYSDNTSENIYLSNQAVDISGFNTGIAAESQLVTISYKGFSDSYTITISARTYDDNINYIYVDQNFDDAVLDVSDYITDPSTSAWSVPSGKPVKVNAINAATGNILPWYTTNLGTKSSANDFYAPRAIDTNQDGSTNYALMPNGQKKQSSVYLTLDKQIVTIDPDTGDSIVTTEPDPVSTVKGERLYLDIRVKRVSTADDDVTLAFADSSGRVIFNLYYKSGYYPRLTASANYGYVTGSSPAVSNYPYSTDWVYLRAIFRFDNSTFKLFVGDSIDNLVPFIDGIDDYTFANSAASNLYKISASTKGSLGIDDFKLYSVIPPVAPDALNLTISGKPNLGAELVGSYEYSCEGFAEEGSVGWWEASADTSFVDAVQLTEKFATTGSAQYTYTIDENATGKYVRFCVQPSNEEGTVGDKAYSAATAYKANCFDATLSVTGNIKNGTVWDFKAAQNSYGGRAVVTSTLSQPASYKLVAVFYKDTDSTPEIVGIKTTDIYLENAAATESGAISETFSTETVYSVPSGTNGSGYTIKVFLVNDMGSIKPIGKYVYAGRNF